MKKIVVFDTALGTSNNGDEIIMESIHNEFKELIDNNFSLRLATHVNNFSFLQMCRNNGKINYFKNADYKFIFGTNLIAQKRIGKVNSQWQLKLSNIPIYEGCILVGAGCTFGGDKTDALAKMLYKKVLSKKYYHSVRDEQTKKVVESLGVKAINTGCPTLWCFTPEFCNEIPETKAEECIITVSGYADQFDTQMDQKMIDIVKSNYKKVYCYIQTTEDEKYLNKLKNTEDIVRVYSLNKYKEILNTKDIDYVGTRLHGGIYAMQNKCRSIIISIDHRARGFYETNNIPILERNSMDKLDNMINSKFKTEIRINQKAIDSFKNQFK